MTPEQITIFAILGAALLLFAWGRWSIDVVAMMALFACVLSGLVDPAEAFGGFGHTAVITVIAVLAIGRALANSGLIDLIASHLAEIAHQPFTQLAALCAVIVILSAFMNNVGALALLMPVAISMARKFDYSPARLLMPLSFASILGGLTTLIGTPPNIIISNYRRELGGSAFGMFDFTPVGLTLALLGTAFIVLIGWRLIPHHRRTRPATEELFEISDYVTEVRVTEDSDLVAKTVAELEDAGKGRLTVLGLIREDRWVIGRIRLERLQPNDILLVRGPSSVLEELVEAASLELVAREKLEEDLREKDLSVMEAVLMPRSRAEGRTPASLHLRTLYGVTVLAVARQGRSLKQRLRNVHLRAGDVLLLQGEKEALPETLVMLGCMPLAGRGPSFQARRTLLPLAIFGMAVTALVAGLLPAAIAFMGAVGLMVLSGLLPVREVYDSIDWPVVVLLAAMIPVGGALETTGATQLIAGKIAELAGGVSPLIVIGLLIVVTMTLSDVMNNAATAVVMAPIAAGIAQQLGVSPDPFLMAVAVGASSAFLTPIGHQNNTLVMGPGGYRFGDFWRLGLPLEILLVAAAAPLIAWVWPL